jgi:hypothetical protein
LRGTTNVAKSDLGHIAGMMPYAGL